MVYEFQQSCKAYMKRKKIHVIPHGMRSKSVEQKKMCNSNSSYTLQRHLAYQNLFESHQA